MDFLKPPAPVVGVSMLAVRDLASCCQLLWQEYPVETAEFTCATLVELFDRHPPPLVLKCDNGSPFIAEMTHALLAECPVGALDRIAIPRALCDLGKSQWPDDPLIDDLFDRYWPA